MKKIFNFLGVISLLLFSFYLTDKVSLIVSSKSILMKQIIEESKKYYSEPVNAIIDNENSTIIPGKNGKEVDKEESYLQMHEFGVFNYNYLVLKSIKPKLSLNDNKDKYIVSGNKNNRKVSLVVFNNKKIESFLKNKGVNYDVITSLAQDIDNYAENINAAYDKRDFKLLNRYLKNNNKICIAEYSNMDLCKKYDYFIVKPRLILKEYNISEVKKGVDNGSIIFIDSTATIDNVNLLLKELNYKNLQIVFISELIDENS